MHVGEHVANALSPADNLIDWKWLVAVALHDLEEVLALDQLHDQVRSLPLLNEIKNPGHDRQILQRAQDLGFATKEV